MSCRDLITWQSTSRVTPATPARWHALLSPIQWTCYASTTSSRYTENRTMFCFNIKDVLSQWCNCHWNIILIKKLYDPFTANYCLFCHWISRPKVFKTYLFCKRKSLYQKDHFSTETKTWSSEVSTLTYRCHIYIYVYTFIYVMQMKMKIILSYETEVSWVWPH